MCFVRYVADKATPSQPYQADQISFGLLCAERHCCCCLVGNSHCTLMPHDAPCQALKIGDPVASGMMAAGGLQAAYAGPVPFQRDGLLLLHKEGHYDLGTSPLALLWKDAQSSRYFIETDAKGNVSPQQIVVLQCLPNGTVGTGDEPPCSLAPIPEPLAHADSSQAR